MKKKIVVIVLLVGLIIGGKIYYDVNLNHNFKTITENKVYKSGVIPPDEIEDYVKKYNLKSIIDLRFPESLDEVNNPEIPIELTNEKNTVEKIEGVKYFNVGSEQVPDQKTLDSFYKILDDSTNYPLLIHCYHGEGRAPLFSALYRIEYEGWSNEKARDETRFLVKWSSFDNGKPKGEFLLNYKPRNKK